jgi:hypothetical protein
MKMSGQIYPPAALLPNRLLKYTTLTSHIFDFIQFLGVIDTSNPQFMILERRFLIDRPEPFDLYSFFTYRMQNS